jgi:serine protease inhibitor ecotin
MDLVRGFKNAALVLLLAAAPVSAVPRLDLSGYPKAAAGDRRWVIQLPGVLPPNSDAALSSNPADWRVQLLVGQMVQLDCNRQMFGGKPAEHGADRRHVSRHRKSAGNRHPTAAAVIGCFDMHHEQSLATQILVAPGDKHRPDHLLLGIDVMPHAVFGEQRGDLQKIYGHGSTPAMNPARQCLPR